MYSVALRQNAYWALDCASVEVIIVDGGHASRASGRVCLFSSNRRQTVQSHMHVTKPKRTAGETGLGPDVSQAPANSSLDVELEEFLLSWVHYDVITWKRFPPHPEGQESVPTQIFQVAANIWSLRLHAAYFPSPLLQPLIPRSFSCPLPSGCQILRMPKDPVSLLQIRLGD